MTDEGERGFYWLSEAWYAKANLEHSDFVDEIMFGIYHKEGGTSGEVSMRWIELGKDISPRLCCFNDSWKVFGGFIDLILELAKHDGGKTTPQDFSEILKKMEFKDLTQRVRE